MADPLELAVFQYMERKMDARKELKSLPFPKSSDELLAEMGKFAILSVQLNAYLPLSIVNGKLCLKYFTISFIFQALFYVASILSVIFLSLNSGGHSKMEEKHSITEDVIVLFVSITSLILGTYDRLFGFIKRTTTLELWKRNVELIDDFFPHSGSNLSVSVLYTHLSGIRSSVRTSFAATVALILALHLSSHAFFPAEMTPLLLVSLHVYTYAQTSHAGQGIWLCFFLKCYSALYRIIQLRLRSLSVGGSEYWVNDFDAFHSARRGKLEIEIYDCYKLYMKVGNQVKAFSNHFQHMLFSEFFLCFFSIIAFLFMFLRRAVEFDISSKLMVSAHFHSLLVIVYYGKILYNLGTEGSCLSRSAAGVLDRLHELNSTNGLRLSFQVRQAMQMFAMKISSNPPVVDAGQYFNFDRKLIATVRKIFKFKKN